ncbi:MAG TPA: FG-GAP-like repeat-containing protein [Vicinamibacterales bacterium]|nr:FG-GAP-like repeat-containing protein [Vicinamibacterales bacterium]
MTRRAPAALAVALAGVLVAPVVPTALQPKPSAREDAFRANNLGVARLEQYNYQDAAGAFRQALDLDSSLQVARVNLAIALLYAGNAEEALATAQAALEESRDVLQAYYVAGLAARALGDAETALKAFERVAGADPADAGSRINLGQILLQQRDYAEAVPRFREALAAEPFNATAAYGLATALTRSGEAERGREAMKQFEALRDHPAAITYSQTYLEQGRYGEAIASTGAEAGNVDPAPPAVKFAEVTGGLPAAGAPAGRGVDATSAPGGVTLIDADGDGDLDLVVTGAGGARYYSNDAGRFVDATAKAGLDRASSPATAAVAADFDNDGQTDLLLLTPLGVQLFRRTQQGRFEDVTDAAGLRPARGNARSAAFVDVDHDGDLDLFIGSGTAAGPGPAGRPRRWLFRNDGKGTFTDITDAAGLAGATGADLAVAPTDFDNGRDIDLIVLEAGSGVRLYRNLRDGAFRDVAGDVGLPAGGAFTTLAVADADKDTYTDVFLGRSDAPGVIARSDGRGRFVAGPTIDSGSPTISQFFDYDNDGLLDLFAAGGREARLFRNLGTTWSEVSREAGLSDLAAALSGDIASVALGDTDRDGDTDVILALAGGGVRHWRNDGGNRHRSVAVHLEGRVSNRQGIGAKVEIRAGSLRQKLEVSATTPAMAPSDLVLGIGTRTQADVVRVIWPSGTLQAETPADLKPLTIAELDRKPSSCPYLYTWNGSRFEFLSDFMGGGEIGYWQGPNRWNTPDPDEYVRIPGDRLVPRNGRYELRITNELEEALFVDRLQLVAVDHASDVDAYPYEGLGAPARDRFELATARGARPPRAAFDEHGHDVRERLAAVDRRYPDDFTLLDIRGYAEPHELRLDLGEAAPRAVLLATGWTDYAFSSDNIAAHQRGLTLEPPALDVRTSDGVWRSLLPNIGIPVGRPQTVVVDLRGQLASGEREVRIRTNMRIYWDQILVDDSGGGAPVRISRLDPIVADLRWRGFSLPVTPDGREPYGYDYDRVSPTSPWKTMAGRYTREGDVLELVRGVDDMFVVSRPGDEIALEFDAGGLPPLGAGERRTFLLYAHGYSKEMDIGSATPHYVAPLPFRAMRGYPYEADQQYPSTHAHREYLERYNTRVVSKSLPPLETAGQ